MMTIETVTAELRTKAVCETDHPADAATALLVAAVEILCQRFQPQQIAEMLIAGVQEAVLLATPEGSA